MISINEDIANKLASKIIEILDKSNDDIDKVCWMVVHEHVHGFMPVEYDIREIDEKLYLLLLKKVRSRLGH
ncbi:MULTISPECIES: hypothetical protein [unclassified Prochlorococcus]|uniref:hypothetical protein n=1 Tax=unclassified Prochlorococcus TaxID=2627481 RepID=UPI000533904D|nr:MULTISPECIES: hypothetical protein [unclassified Prochlorococcus]KGG16478.1 hypothetical protein EV06_0316 [Prochlorococcus sp. MIT 0602]KGG17047.1 hypothetical protein EV07_0477 [Prochlorococcus sp. MIT 0603]